MRPLGLASMALLVAACGRLEYDAGLSERDAEVRDADALDAGDLDASARDAGAPDSAARDAGAADAARDSGEPADAAADSGEPADAGGTGCPLGALFCDGYEDPVLGAWSYSVQLGGTAERTTTRSRSGAASLVCMAEGAASKEARYSTTAPGAARAGELWVRAFYFLPSTVALDGSVSLLSLSEREPPYQGMHVLLDADSVDLVDTIGSARLPGDRALPRDRWVCIEVRVQLDETAGALDLHVDGARVAQASGIDTVPTRGVEVAELGIHYATAEQPPVELYVDDVVVAVSRVGCD